LDLNRIYLIGVSLFGQLSEDVMGKGLIQGQFLSQANTLNIGNQSYSGYQMTASDRHYGF